MNIKKYLASILAVAFVVGIQAETNERGRKAKKNNMSQILEAHKEAIITGAAATAVGLGLAMGTYYKGKSKGKNIGIGARLFEKLSYYLNKIDKDYDNAATSEKKKYLNDEIEKLNTDRKKLVKSNAKLENDKEKNADSIITNNKDIKVIDMELKYNEDLKLVDQNNREDKKLVAMKELELYYYKNIRKEVKSRIDNIHNKVVPQAEKVDDSKKETK
ncbi:hypothetical protein KAT08_03600 [Candidatus Babeliales bacterium]|nr:hypothetical protein [Candidatus Babeliales bacterium]